MLALAAEKADGAHPYFTTPDHSVIAREVMGPDKFLAPEQMVVIETDPELARRIARKNMARYLQLPNHTINLRRLGFTKADIDDASDRLVDTIVPWGSVETLVPRIHEHLDAGADHVCVRVCTESTDIPMNAYRSLAEALLG